MHCRPGGLALFVPDDTRESFVPGTDHGGHDGPDRRAARYLEWTWDPDPADTTVTTEYAFVLRDADGSVRVCHETHRTGLFGRAVWLGLLAAVGFEPRAVLEATTEDRPPRELFIGHRPPRLRRRQDGSIQRSPSRARSASDGPHVSRK